MAAGGPDLTLEEIDALIDEAQGSKDLDRRPLDLVCGAGIRQAPEDPEQWRAELSRPHVWISDRTRIGNRAEAEWLAEG